MKRFLTSALFLTLLGATAADAAVQIHVGVPRHHRHRVCYVHHHHRVCTWR